MVGLMEDKIIKIEKMLTYLCKNGAISLNSCRNIGNRFFQIKEMISLNLPKEDYREHHEYTISFKEKSLNMYAYDESAHNGDHYNCYARDIDFSNILSIFDALTVLCRKKMEDELKKESINRAIDEKMKVMFG